MYGKRIIETERLLLREWTRHDIAPFAAINTHKEVMAYFPRILSYDETMDFYNRIIAEFSECGFGLYAVELKSGGEFIGYTGFHRFDFKAPFSPGIEIGWRLDYKYWNCGYATEAARACVEYAREQRLFDRVYSFTAISNRRSERVMQKLGMKYAGKFRHPGLPCGHRLEEHVLYMTEISE